MKKIDLLIFTFPGEENARDALDVLKAMKKGKVIDLINVAIISRDHKGHVHIKETADPGGKQGAMLGAVTGALIGLLGGPVGVVIGAAAGAGMGGYAAEKIDMGIPNERLKDIADMLQPGKSAIVALIEHSWAEKAVDEMGKYDVGVIRESIWEEIAVRLEALGGSDRSES